MRLLGGSGDLLLFLGGVGDFRRFLGGVGDRFLLRSVRISLSRSSRVDALVGLDSARPSLAFLDLDFDSKLGVGVEEREASVDAQDDEEAVEDDEEEDEDD